MTSEVPVAITVVPGGGAFGWETALEQAGWDRVFAAMPRTPVAVTSGAVPSELAAWVATGGILVVDGARGGDGLVPSSLRRAVVSGFVEPERGDWVAAPGIVTLYGGEGAGEVRVHEDRVVKHDLVQGRYASVHQQRHGRGLVIWTGLPLTDLLVAHGDRLRPVAAWSPVTERAASVDKAGVAETLGWIVAHAMTCGGIASVRRAAWPKSAVSVFVLRVDVDGVYGDRARLLGEAAAGEGVRATFFLNRELIERHPGDLGDWLAAHDVGQHADVHDLYDDPAADLSNLRAGEQWVRETTGRQPVGFVAPRGLWSPSLDRALARLGYAWSSDFGLATDMRPFWTGAGVLQLPVHAYSPERAVRWADEQGRPRPKCHDVAAHYLRHLDEQVARGRAVHVYGHPEVLGAMASGVVPPLIRAARRRGLPVLTLDELAQWWGRRAKARVDARWRPGSVPRLLIRRADEGVGLVLNMPTPTELVIDEDDQGIVHGEVHVN